MTPWSRGSLLAFQALSLHHRAWKPRGACRTHGTLLPLGPWLARRAGSSLLTSLPLLPGESIQASLPLFSPGSLFPSFSMETGSTDGAGRSWKSRWSLGSPQAHLPGQPRLARLSWLPPHAFAAVSSWGTRQAQGALFTLFSLHERSSARISFLSLRSRSARRPSGSHVSLWAGESHGAIEALLTLFSRWAGAVDGLQKPDLLTAGGGRRLGLGGGFRQHSHLTRTGGDVTAGLQFRVSGVTVNHDPLEVKVNRHAVVEALADRRLALDVDVLPLLEGQRLHQRAVDVQGGVLGLHAQGHLVPVPVEEVVDPGAPEDHPDGVLHGANGAVLHGLVLAVQPDGHLRDAVLVDDLPDIPVFSPG